MKKLLLLILLITSSIAINAQEKGWAVGAKVGDPAGLTIRKYLNNDKNINFGRYEFLMGSRIDINPCKLFGFYLGAGISTQNGISMFSETYNRRNNGRLAHFYNERIYGAIFINSGITVKFGKTKSIYNNYNLYNAIDLNNSSEAGDNNINTGNSEIPKSINKIKDIKLSDIQDLIETQDLH